ncbi:reverse transcriptase domain-containing protein [Tanacetum coccineum]
MVSFIQSPIALGCMLAIFHDMIKESVEVFMDDFLVFGKSFDNCLKNLDNMIQRCKDANLVLNWEKCHFMVKEVIMLGHKVSGAGLEVDKAKIDVISKLPPPTNVKGIRSFLGHAGFYRRFIKDFSKITRPLTKLLEKDTPFEFNDECHKAFNSLKEKLTCTLVIVSPNWNLPFELICDASDFTVGAVLGQKDGKHFHPIYFASKTLNAAQQKYTVIKKELKAVGIVMPEGKGWFLYLMMNQDFYDGGLNGPCIWYSAMVISSTFLDQGGSLDGWKPLSPPNGCGGSDVGNRFEWRLFL